MASSEPMGGCGVDAHAAERAGSVVAAVCAELSGAGPLSARGRSTSPAQYSGRPYSHGAAPRTGLGVSSGPYSTAWHENTLPSPRTARQPGASAVAAAAHGAAAGTELRLSVLSIAEAQRQADADRRAMLRRLDQLERRLSEQLHAPQAREKLADLQGSVSGVLDEMTALSRRLEGLDEKMRARLGSCEETQRQKQRELEQTLHGHYHKTSLAISTTEEMHKRNMARLRKATQTIDEHARRLETLENDVAWRRQETARGPPSSSLLELEARVKSIEHHQLTFAAELQELDAAASARGVALLNGHHTTASDSNESDLESLVHNLERQLTALTSRTASHLDEHSSTLANMRVRSDGQEQRLSALVERMEGVINQPLESLRTEFLQLRDHERAEQETRFMKAEARLDSIAESSEEMGSELRSVISGLSSELSKHGGRPEDHPLFRHFQELVAAQDQALRRLEANAVDPARQHGAYQQQEDSSELYLRLEGLEHRISCVEQTDQENELDDKADRSELMRLDAQVRELSEPLRRLSQRTASSEARSAALERRVEQLQAQCALLQGSRTESKVDCPSSAAIRSQAPLGPSVQYEARIDALSDGIADLSARVMELESLASDHSEHVLAGNLPLDQSLVGHVEKEILEFSKLVSGELKELQDQHEEIMKIAVIVPKTGDLERHVNELAKQVEEELKACQVFQTELKSYDGRAFQLQLSELKERVEKLDQIALSKKPQHQADSRNAGQKDPEDSALSDAYDNDPFEAEDLSTK